jgi:hypothetical protein
MLDARDWLSLVLAFSSTEDRESVAVCSKVHEVYVRHLPCVRVDQELRQSLAPWGTWQPWRSRPNLHALEAAVSNLLHSQTTPKVRGNVEIFCCDECVGNGYVGGLQCFVGLHKPRGLWSGVFHKFVISRAPFSNAIVLRLLPCVCTVAGLQPGPQHEDCFRGMVIEVGLRSLRCVLASHLLRLLPTLLSECCRVLSD